MNGNIKAGGDIHAGDSEYSLGTQEEYDKFVKGRNQSLGKVRIKVLAQQSRTHFPKTETSGEFWLFDELKFAELIVREMLVTCEDHPAWTGRMIGEEIKQHFGVE